MSNNEAKFTKGDWSARSVVGNGRVEIYSMVEFKASRLCVMDRYDGAIHDANMMAAAPKMYAMLDFISQLKKQLDDGFNVHGAISGLNGSIDMIDGLLAEARGEK